MSGQRPNYSRASTSIAGGGWRSTAFAKLAKVKDYVVTSEVSKSAYNAVSNRVVAYRTGFDPVTGERRQTWEEWAKEKRQRRWEEQRGTEKIALFPGWAVRRYPTSRKSKSDDVQQFTIELFVSGFASSLRTPEQATRSQKAFMRIARGFSALPRLPPPPESILHGSSSASPLTQSPNPSTDDLSEELARMGVVLPPRPDDITEETESRTLSAPRIAQTRDSRVVDYAGATAQYGTPSSSNATRRPPPPAPTQVASPVTSSKSERSNTASSVNSMLSVDSVRSNTGVTSIHPDMDTGILRQLHANLDARLQPFWSSKLENRTVRISIYARSTVFTSERATSKRNIPLASAKVQTNAQGYFSSKLSISFEDLCTHDQALHIAFGAHVEEHPLYVHAELLPVSYSQNSSGSGAETTGSIGVSRDRTKGSDSQIWVETELPLSSARVRVISDIDDTIKISEVLMGVRSIFHNVFVRHLDELVVPGMPELYAKLASRGARFHYVSNGPFELLPVLMEFFGVSNLPRGSVKLKSYGGRNLFQGLWGESAADRKRGNVVEVLESFLDSKFILVGDTGEQDLELYSALAEERPNQIVALFLRDVTPATPPPTAPSSPTLTPMADHKIVKKSSTSSLRSIKSLSGGGNKTKEDLPKLHISRPTQDSAGSGSSRNPVRSVTDPNQATRPPTPYKVYTPHQRGSSGYFDGPTPIAKRSELPPLPGQFSPPSLDFGMDPASALVSAAATAGTGHSADVVADTTRAGILAKKEALRSRTEAAKARVPGHILLRVFREPWECEDEAMQILDTLEGRNRSSWNTDEELLLG